VNANQPKTIFVLVVGAGVAALVLINFPVTVGGYVDLLIEKQSTAAPNSTVPFNQNLLEECLTLPCAWPKSENTGTNTDKVKELRVQTNKYLAERFVFYLESTR